MIKSGKFGESLSGHLQSWEILFITILEWFITETLVIGVQANGGGLFTKSFLCLMFLRSLC